MVGVVGGVIVIFPLLSGLLMPASQFAGHQPDDVRDRFKSTSFSYFFQVLDDQGNRAPGKAISDLPTWVIWPITGLA
jgi:hypothetical protein